MIILAFIDLLKSVSRPVARRALLELMSKYPEDRPAHFYARQAEHVHSHDIIRWEVRVRSKEAS